MREGQAWGGDNAGQYLISKGFFTKVIFSLKHLEGVQHRVEQVFIMIMYLYVAS